MAESKWTQFDDRIKEVLLDTRNFDLGYTALSRLVFPEGTPGDWNALRTYIRRNFSDIDPVSPTAEQYDDNIPAGSLTALANDGTLMSIQQFCDKHGIDFAEIRSYKLVTHTGVPYYNIQSNKIETTEAADFYKSLVEDLQQYAPKWEKIEREVYRNEDSHLLVVDP